MADVLVEINGSDVTGVCVRGAWTPRLNRPAQAVVVINMEDAAYDVGDRLKISLLIGTTFDLVFHGMILQVETDTGEDTGYTTYTAKDPMELWQWRPVRDADGDFSKPNINLLNGATLTGPSMLEAMLYNTEGDSTAQGNPLLTPPSDAEGPTFLTFGTFEAGGVDLTGAPVDWPMMIAELTALLISTGELDVVITPTDPGGDIMGTVDAYNGDYGVDLASSVAFQYGMGAFNIERLRWNRDGNAMVNKYWLYGGPRIQSAADPAGDQHWCFNVTGDDPNLAYPPGGALSPPASATNNQLGVRRVASQAAYGVRMLVDIFDAYDDDCVPGFGTIGRDLFRRRWQIFSWGAAEPRELIHITPARDSEIGTFGIGDLVLVEATSAVRGGFSGVQRVYGYTISWEAEGSVLELSELQTSADMEGV